MQARASGRAFSRGVADAARDLKFPEPYGAGMPGWFAVPSIESMGPDHLHLVTFKWNVHTQGRTASQKYLTEIVHHNPLWMHTSAAEARGPAEQRGGVFRRRLNFAAPCKFTWCSTVNGVMLCCAATFA